jgi:hypothetical protein
LIAGLAFVLNAILGIAVSLQLNLSDPLLGGSSRDHWLTSGTPLTAPVPFMVAYALFLLLATREHWVGIVGIVLVSLLTLVSALSLTADWPMVQRVIEQHLTLGTGFVAGVLVVLYPAVVALGIATLAAQRHAASATAPSR